MTTKVFKKKKTPLYKPIFGGFTSRLTTHLKYVQSNSLNATASGLAVQVFRVNNPYDPDYTGTGHQPMWYDTYTAIYDGVRVTKATITMTMTSNHIVNAAAPNQVDGDTTSVSQYYAAEERGNRMFIMRDQSPSDYPSELDTLIEEGGTNFVWKWAPQNTSLRMNQLKYTCVPYLQVDTDKKDGRLAMATGGTTPTDFYALYFICGVASIDGTDPDAGKFHFEIDYEVEFFDKKGNQSQM